MHFKHHAHDIHTTFASLVLRDLRRERQNQLVSPVRQKSHELTGLGQNIKVPAELSRSKFAVIIQAHDSRQLFFSPLFVCAALTPQEIHACDITADGISSTQKNNTTFADLA